jgi:excisionase family DNA binding protein
MTDTRTTTRQLYRVTEAMALLSLSRSVLYEELRCGRLRSVHVGRTRLIPANAITDYVTLLEREATEFGKVS